MTSFLLLVKVAIEVVVLQGFVVRPRRTIGEGCFHNSNRHKHDRRVRGSCLCCQIGSRADAAQRFRRRNIGPRHRGMLTLALAVSHRTGKVELEQATGAAMRQPYSMDVTAFAEELVTVNRLITAFVFMLLPVMTG